MNADESSSAFFGSESAFDGVDAAFVNSRAQLDGAGNIYRARYGACDALDKLGISHKSRALAVRKYLVYGAAHIDVDSYGIYSLAGVRERVRCLCHYLGL